MKRIRIFSVILMAATLTFVLTLVGMIAIPVNAAIRAADVDLKVTLKDQYLSSKTGDYCFSFQFSRGVINDATCKAYLYNAAGKQVACWVNSDGNGYEIPDYDSTRTFSVDLKKYPAGTYTFKLVASVPKAFVYLPPEVEGMVYDLKFSWTYTVNTADAARSIELQPVSMHTMKNGKIVPRVNVAYKNLKGETLTFRIYDKNGTEIYQNTTGKLKNNSGTYWNAWSGRRSDGHQYTDGTYTVTVTSSGGTSATSRFYLDFPEKAKTVKAIPSIHFKEPTTYTHDDGRIVPRINILCKNIKGQALSIYVYDYNGYLVFENTGRARATNDETGWFTWSGVTDGIYYPDDYYTVEILSSGGLTISKEFYLMFPHNAVG